MEEEIALKRSEIAKLKSELLSKESELKELLGKRNPDLLLDCGLTHQDVSRYSRQLLLPEISVSGQLSLKKGRVLIVGAGGLGCPAATYLISAGIGTLGVSDYDTVEMSNLHRQMAHSENKIGLSKAQSLKQFARELNSSVEIRAVEESMSSDNALEIIRDYHVVLDCSDNVATRYLLNDACVISGKPLVSGSALRFEGQITVYNYPPGVGTTYRCLYPEPPPPETVTNCSDGGVLGVIPGIIGCLQALEALKILIGGPMAEFIYSGKMLLYDGFSGRFRTVNLRPRKENSGKIAELIDYTQFCGSQPHDKELNLRLLNDKQRIKAAELSEIIKDGDLLVVDVRTEQENEIAKIENSVNLPLARINDQSVGELSLTGIKNLVCVCRRGNDSQKAALKLKSFIKSDVNIRDLSGGLHSWAKNVDSKFPIY